MNLSGLLIGSDDAKALGEFYTKLFGKPGWDDGGYVGWQIGNGGLTIGPHSDVHGKSDQPGRIIWSIETEDVAGDFARFRDAGAVVIAEPYTFEGAPDAWISTLADPDGNYFQLVSPFDLSGMGDTGG